MINRRKSRELALQALYSCEMSGDDVFEPVLQAFSDENEGQADVVEYARQLTRKTLAAKTSIDEIIKKHAANWELKRMAAIDRNILRMAVAELRFFGQIPYKVVIDEAVEIAKRYGTDDSGKFVNGIIDSIHKEMIQNNKNKESGVPDGTNAPEA